MFAAHAALMTPTVVASVSPVTIVGTAASATTTVTLPAHQAGDVFVIFAIRYQSNTIPTKPGSSSSVPTWNDLDTATGTNGDGCRTAYAVATKSGHTSGTWSNASNILVAVLRGASATTPIGGHAKQGTTQNGGATSPAITLSQTDGTSAILTFFYNDWAQSVSAAPAGYTQGAGPSQLNANSGGGCVNYKNDTTSDGSSVQSINTSGQTGDYYGATVEVCAH